MLHPAPTKIPKRKIIETLDQWPSKILRRKDIEVLLAGHKNEWGLAADTTLRGFLSYLLHNTQLEEARFQFPVRIELRYTWGKVPPLETVFTLRPNSYYTHFTALSLNQLTEQTPKTIYLNTEQPRKQVGATASLEQNRIDFAFKRPARQTTMCASYSGYQVCLLNGMHTDQLGVVDHIGPEGEKIRVTNIERSLIDAVVRPAYAGGVYHVLEAFKQAKGRVSINKLTAMLKQLAYIYPYFQAIAFYVQRSGVYPDSTIALFKQFEMKYDFYLAHDMRETEYCAQWRLFIPKGF